MSERLSELCNAASGDTLPSGIYSCDRVKGHIGPHSWELYVLEQELQRLRSAADGGMVADAHAYLSRLFKHYAPQCEPLDTLLGVCTQIDNLLVGLASGRVAAPAGEYAYSTPSGETPEAQE